MKKRLLSILLAFCMLTGLFPSQAIAIGEVSSFADVKPTDWYYEGIEYVRKNNLMNGAGEGTFLPNEPMSRSMTATALHRLAGSPAPTKAAEFSDVPEGQWYSQAVAWAAERQIVSGYGDGRFGPAYPVTRQQLAAILYRYAQQSDRTGLEKTADLSAFSDQGQIGEYALAPMQWAVGSGLLTGTSSTTLDPNGLATRGQIATILARFCQEATPAEKFTITFDLNYGENPVYQTQQVESGKTASKPANPTRSGYAFAGWHTKKEGGAPYDFAAPITSDLTLYALWNQAASGGIGGSGGFGGGGSSSGGSGSGNSESPYIYSITGVAMAEGTPQITVNTDKACVLQVRLLDDEGKNTLDTVTTQASAQLELEKIPVPLNVTPPEYFRLEASLLDENGKELCDKFLCVNYTSAYAAFAAATVDDFEGQIVLNFDEQPDKNFGVLPEGAIQAQAAPTSRAGGNVVVLDNADHRLDETKIGTIIAVHNAQDEVEDLIKVRKITFSEDQAIIEPDPDAALEDFYDLLKVDMTVDADESMVDMSEADEGVALIPSGEVQQERIGGAFEHTIGISLKFGIKDSLKQTPISVNLNGKLKTAIHLKIEFEKDYFYLSIKNVVDLTVSGDIKAGISSESGSEAKPMTDSDGKTEVNLGSIKLPTNVPGLKATMKLKAPVKVSLEGALAASYTIHREETISYSSKDKFHHGSKCILDNSTTISAALSVEIGFRLEIGFEFLHNILNLSLSPELCMIISGKISRDVYLDAVISGALALLPQTVKSVHTCTACIDGDVKIRAAVSLNGSIKPLSLKISNTLAAKTYPLDDFYLSLNNEADSPLGGQVKFGFGKCPNQKYRTEFAVQNSEGQTVSDAQLTVSKGAQQIPDVASGKAVYLYNGDYTAAAQADGQQGSKDFKVNGKAQTVTVQLGKGTDEPDKPDVSDQPKIPKNSDHTIAAGYSHSGVIDENGSLWVWGRNERGQLGNGTIDTALSPIKILDDVRSISIGSYHMAAIRTDNSLWIWGCNHDGELGNGIIGNDKSTIWNSWIVPAYPIQTVPVKIMEDVSSVSCGDEFTAVVKTDGSLWMWGINEFGQIGNGTTKLVTRPIKIMDDVVAVSAGNNHTAALKSDGTLWTWGNNDYNMLLDNYSLSPVQILDDVIAIEEGAYNTAAIRTDDSLWMRGRITYDGLYMSTSDVMIPVLQDVNSVSLGYSHYGAIKSDGSLWLWGSGDHGRLGLTNGVQSDPREMTQSTMDDVLFVGIGQVQTIAIKFDGSVWTWGGENTGGQLGNGTTDSAWLPTKIPGLTAKTPNHTENDIPTPETSLISTKNLP